MHVVGEAHWIFAWQSSFQWHNSLLYQRSLLWYVPQGHCDHENRIGNRMRNKFHIEFTGTAWNDNASVDVTVKSPPETLPRCSSRGSSPRHWYQNLQEYLGDRASIWRPNTKGNSTMSCLIKLEWEDGEGTSLHTLDLHFTSVGSSGNTANWTLVSLSKEQ